MGDQVKSIFGVIVRRLVLAASGGLVAAGYLSEGNVETITGAITALGLVAWSIYDAKRRNKA